jgi:TolA-binding protein
MLDLQARIIDSLAAGRQALRLLEGRLIADMTDVQRQLLAVQELTGQSQRRLTDLKAQIDARAEAAAVTAVPTAGAPGADTTGRGAPPAGPRISADQMYQNARNMFLRASLATARRGFQEFIATYPNDPRVPDALAYVGDSFEAEAPDSAFAYWALVVSRHPQATRAAEALYKTGRLAEQRQDVARAREAYQRVVSQYPRSDMADLARQRLATLRP